MGGRVQTHGAPGAQGTGGEQLEQEMAEYLGVARYEHAATGTIIEMELCQAPVDGDVRFRAFSAAQPKGEVSL